MKLVIGHMYKGSLSGLGQDNADKPYMKQGDEQGRIFTYSETFKNNRAQYYKLLADRCYATFRCVVRGEYVDPDEMISFDSDGIDDLAGLRSEITRIPLKPNANNIIQLMTKQDMKRMQIDSPNQADSVVMCFANPMSVNVEWKTPKVNAPKRGARR